MELYALVIRDASGKDSLCGYKVDMNKFTIELVPYDMPHTGRCIYMTCEEAVDVQIRALNGKATEIVMFVEKGD